MAINFKFDFDNLGKKIIKGVVNDVSQATDQVFLDVKIFSPVRSGKYASKHRHLGVKIEGNKVIGTITNEGEYSERVEKGFRKNAVNWNLKNLGTTYFSKGANVYKKAIEKNKNNFINKLKGQ